jgi:hypothetical protein
MKPLVKRTQKAQETASGLNCFDCVNLRGMILASLLSSHTSRQLSTHIVLYMKRNMYVCVHRQATYFCNSLCISQRAEGNVVSFLSRCTKGIATGAISVSISPVAITLLQNSELSVELSLTGQTKFIAGTLWCLTEPPAGKSHYEAPIKVFYKASKSAVNYTRL